MTFFGDTGVERDRVNRIVDDALTDMDDGEMFLEYRQSESLVFDDGRLKSASFDTAQGFGLRAVSGEATGYAHASELSEAAMQRAATAVLSVKSGHGGAMTEAPNATNRHLYTDASPLNQMDFDAKVALLVDIDRYARAADDRVRRYRRRSPDPGKLSRSCAPAANSVPMSDPWCASTFPL